MGGGTAGLVGGRPPKSPRLVLGAVLGIVTPFVLGRSLEAPGTTTGGGIDTIPIGCTRTTLNGLGRMADGCATIMAGIPNGSGRIIGAIIRATGPILTGNSGIVRTAASIIIYTNTQSVVLCQAAKNTRAVRAVTNTREVRAVPNTRAVRAVPNTREVPSGVPIRAAVIPMKLLAGTLNMPLIRSSIESSTRHRTLLLVAPQAAALKRSKPASFATDPAWRTAMYLCCPPRRRW